MSQIYKLSFLLLLTLSNHGASAVRGEKKKRDEKERELMTIAAKKLGGKAIQVMPQLPKVEFTKGTEKQAPKLKPPKNALKFGDTIYLQSAGMEKKFLHGSQGKKKIQVQTNDPTKGGSNTYKALFKWTFLKFDKNGGSKANGDCVRFGDTVVIKNTRKNEARPFVKTNPKKTTDAQVRGWPKIKMPPTPAKLKAAENARKEMQWIILSEPSKEQDPAAIEDKYKGMCVTDLSVVFIESKMAKKRWLRGNLGGAKKNVDNRELEKDRKNFKWIVRRDLAKRSIKNGDGAITKAKSWEDKMKQTLAFRKKALEEKKRAWEANGALEDIMGDFNFGTVFGGKGKGGSNKGATNEETCTPSKTNVKSVLACPMPRCQPPPQGCKYDYGHYVKSFNGKCCPKPCYAVDKNGNKCGASNSGNGKGSPKGGGLGNALGNVQDHIDYIMDGIPQQPPQGGGPNNNGGGNFFNNIQDHIENAMGGIPQQGPNNNGGGNFFNNIQDHIENAMDTAGGGSNNNGGLNQAFQNAQNHIQNMIGQQPNPFVLKTCNPTGNEVCPSARCMAPPEGCHYVNDQYVEGPNGCCPQMCFAVDDMGNECRRPAEAEEEVADETEDADEDEEEDYDEDGEEGSDVEESTGGKGKKGGMNKGKMMGKTMGKTMGKKPGKGKGGKSGKDKSGKGPRGGSGRGKPDKCGKNKKCAKPEKSGKMKMDKSEKKMKMDKSEKKMKMKKSGKDEEESEEEMEFDEENHYMRGYMEGYMHGQEGPGPAEPGTGGMTDDMYSLPSGDDLMYGMDDLYSLGDDHYGFGGDDYYYGDDHYYAHGDGEESEEEGDDFHPMFGDTFKGWGNGGGNGKDSKSGDGDAAVVSLNINQENVNNNGQSQNGNTRKLRGSA